MMAESTKTPLTPDDTLAFIYEQFRNYWSVQRELGWTVFGELVRLPDLRPDEYSRTLNRSHATPRRVRARLEEAEVRHAFARQLGVDVTIFRCTTYDQVLAFILPVLAGRHTDSASFIEVRPALALDDDYLLHPNERTSLDGLAHDILSGDQSILLWPSDAPFGASFIAYVLAATRLPGPSFFVHAHGRIQTLSLKVTSKGEAGVPFQSSLTSVAERLGVPSRTRIAPALLDELIRTKSTLFVLGAGAIPETEPSRQDSAIHDLIRQASRRERAVESPCPVVLIGGARKRSDINSQLRQSDLQPITLGGRFEFFQRQWERFCDLRGHARADRMDARLTRAKWFYESVHELVHRRDTFPVHVRLRAFLASNYTAQDYFDPTAGWFHLAGVPIENLPIDIRLHLEDVVYQLRELVVGKRQTELRTARWCSTALYWLTEEAVETLSRPFHAQDGAGSPPRALSPSTNVDTFRNSTRKIANIIHRFSPKGSNARAYAIDIASKAVLQGDWALARISHTGE